MARIGYRWYDFDHDRLLHPVAVKNGHAAEHIIAPATCNGSPTCQCQGRWSYDYRSAVADLRPPTPRGVCGYYAYNSIPYALTKSHAAHIAKDNAVLVELVAWGRIQLHTMGFRAERIALRSVFVSGPLDEELADRYLCNKRPWSEALDTLNLTQRRQLERIMASSYYRADEEWLHGRAT